MVAVAENSSVSVFDIRSQQQVNHFVHNSNLTSLKYNSTYTILIAGDSNGGITKWNFNSQKETYSLSEKQSIFSLDSMLDENYMLIAQGNTLFTSKIAGKEQLAFI